MSLSKTGRLWLAGALAAASTACPIEHLVPTDGCDSGECGGGVAVDGGTGGGGGGVSADGGGAGGGGDSVGGGTAIANTIFVTYGVYELGGLGDGDGGVSVADAICNSVAIDRGFSGTFIALLSTSSRDLRDRIPAGVHGWVNPICASGWCGTSGVFDLPGSPQMPGRIGDSIAIEDPFSRRVATGSTNWGTFAGANCDDWTSRDAGSSYVAGDSSQLISGWANAMTISCDQRASLYCAQVDHASDVLAGPPAGALRVFVTEQRYASGAGRGGFDTACAAEAADAGLLGNFKAYVWTHGANPPQGEGDRYRLDGAQTNTRTPNENTIPFALFPIQVSAHGRTLVAEDAGWPDSPLLIPTDTAVWFGDYTDACNDWFSVTGAARAVEITSLQGDHFRNYSVYPEGTRDCGSPAHVFCVEYP